MTVTAELDKTAALDVTVPFTIDAASTATQGVDYTISTTVAGQVTIPAGSLTSNDITINVTDDGDVEPDETVILNMGSPSNANKGTPDSHTATIENDDTRPGPIPSARYFTVDFLGKITREKMSSSGRLLKPLDGPSPDNTHLFSMEKDTKTHKNGKVVKKITIREALEIPALPSDTVLVGSTYEFEPTDCVFSKPVRLTLGYDVNQLPEHVTSIALAYYDPKKGWIELDTERSVVAEVGKLTAPVGHFTKFAILAKVTTTPPGPTPTPTPPGPTPPGSKPMPLGHLGLDTLELSNLSITTSFLKTWELLTFVIRAGEEATITFTTTNGSDQDGIYTAVLKVNGITRDTKEISLDSGQTQKVVFTITGNMPGSYSVEVGGLNGEFQSVLWINWWLIIVLAALFIFLSWLAWHYGGKKLVRTLVTEKS